MSKVSIGALLAFVCVLPLGCEAIVGNVHGHDDAGAGGIGGSTQGEAGVSASSGAGNAPGESGAGGIPGEAGASGAAAAGASGEGGDSGAAGTGAGCMPVDDGNPCTDDVCVNGAPAHPSTTLGTACDNGATGSQCDGQGACVACLAASDCPGADNACQLRTCSQGVCGFDYKAAGSALPTQTTGDCKTAVCDGQGVITSQNDDADKPVDNTECTSDVCTAGVPSNPNQAAGTVCGTALLCDGNGTCVGCNQPSDCGADTACTTRTCIAHQCGLSYTAAGTAAGTQTAGNCLKSACDGAGNISDVADATDPPPDDGNACTDEACVSGAPQHPNKSNGTACSDGNSCTLVDTCQSGACTAGNQKQCTPLDVCHSAGACDNTTGACSNPMKPAGTLCNGTSVCTATGACVQCNTASDCPGSDTECSVRTCNSNQCGASFTASGTPTSAQTVGDCQQKQCDGSGHITSVPANADVPADDGNQCTSDVCLSGVPSHPPSPSTTTCNQNGGVICNGVGACGQCNTASQCPGVDTECQTRTCSSNQCSFMFQPSGTPTSAQTPNDCQKNQCDGSGNIVSMADNDPPADDGNQCTSEVCTAGVPSHPPKPSTFVLTVGQTPGDCQILTCDGIGGSKTNDDATDLPSDGNECTDDQCQGPSPLTPAEPPSSSTTPCNSGTSFCDGSGACQ